MSVNKVILVGNVGKDPEVKYLDKGNVVASFPLATTERGYKTSAGVEIPERTEWHNIVMWRGLAEIAEKYVRKGSQIYLEGKIRTRNYDDQNGVKRYVTEIFADNMQLLGKRESGDHQSSHAAPAETTTAQAPSQAASSDFTQSAPTDDLPF